MKYLITALALSSVSTMSWSQTYLTPNQLGGGDLPGIHADLVFTLGDGNWTPEVRLPATAADQAKVRIVSTAQFQTQVLQANSDVPLPAMSLASGQSLQYTYSAARKQWEIVAPILSAANDGKPMTLASSQDRATRVRLADGAWAPSVTLPPVAPDGALMLVRSDATWPSRVDSANVLHASTMPLRNKDAYTFVFSERLGKWSLRKGAEVTLSWGALPQGVMPVPTTPLTRLSLPTLARPTAITLPPKAGDRDRIVISSNGAVRQAILNTGAPDVGTLTIGKGQTYEFMWDAAAARWVVLQSPRTQIQAQQVAGDAMPAPQTAVTELLAWDGNWKRTVGLPLSARAGDRVVVKSGATWDFNVVDTKAPTQLNHVVTQGEEVVFVHDGQKWARETDTIRILLTYGQGVSAKLGSSAARVRQLESLRLTNEALENSGARFRFQVANLIEVPTLGADLGEALSRARDNELIQNERSRVQADAVYYEGIESGCGLAWVNSSPNAGNMVGSGSLDCGTTVMRHELGHNMGLNHGNGINPTAMSGNALPYFATPRRVDPVFRLPMGHLATVPDEVTLMDRNAPAVAGFR